MPALYHRWEKNVGGVACEYHERGSFKLKTNRPSSLKCDGVQIDAGGENCRQRVRVN